MTSQYKIILVSDLEGVLSDKGESLLLTARMNSYGTKAIFCVNHSPERIEKAFKPGFDFEYLLSNSKTYSNQEALAEMNKDEWVFIGDEI